MWRRWTAYRRVRRSRPGELPDEREELERSGLFDTIVVLHFDWEIAYDTEGYLRLLDTFSGHIAMQSWQRDRLCSEILRRLGDRTDGRLRCWAPLFMLLADETPRARRRSIPYGTARPGRLLT